MRTKIVLFYPGALYSINSISYECLTIIIQVCKIYRAGGDSTLKLTELNTNRNLSTPLAITTLEKIAAHQRIPGQTFHPTSPEFLLSGRSRHLAVSHCRGLALG